MALSILLTPTLLPHPPSPAFFLLPTIHLTTKDLTFPLLSTLRLYSYFFPNATSPESESPSSDPTPEKAHVINEATSLAPTPAVIKKVGNSMDNVVEKQSIIQSEISASPNTAGKVDTVKKNTSNKTSKLPSVGAEGKSGMKSDYTTSLLKKKDNKTKSKKSKLY